MTTPRREVLPLGAVGALGAHEGVSRRTVLKYGLGSLAVVTVGGSMVLSSATRVSADVVRGRLFISAGERPMIDGLVVPFVGFGSTAGRLELPSGQLEVQTGDTVILTITNNSTMPVGFNVPGVADASAAPIPPGATRNVSFTAPTRPSTFFYVGTVNGSLATGQALGATGALVVLPRGPRTSVEALFPGVRALGHRQPMFGRGSAAPMPTKIAQERTWLFSELNPTTARTLAGGRVALPGDPEPEYFLINGISGMLSTEDHATNLSGHSGGLGEPGDLCWHPTCPAYDAAKNQQYPFDLARAKSLIDQAEQPTEKWTTTTRQRCPSMPPSGRFSNQTWPKSDSSSTWWRVIRRSWR